MDPGELPVSEMSTQSAEEPKPTSEGDPKPASEGDPKPPFRRPRPKIYYCEICKVPCLSALTLQTHFAGIRHKKRERALKEKRAPVISKEPVSVKRPLSKNIRSLKDFMKDPNREEPLIGLEYVVEVRFKGRRSPFYECQLCQFNTEMAPMIQHLTGQRHRKIYLAKHYPDKIKRNPNDGKEEKVQFLRRIAREVEKTEGLKMYKREGYERPSQPSASAKKRARFSSGYKPENDPVRREKAMEYMEDFEITSDKEAALVITIAQSLSEALKAFCEKKATLNHIKSLPPLMKQGMRNASRHKSNRPSEYYQDQPGDSWNHGCLTNGLAQLQSLVQHAPNTSSSPTNSYSYQMREKASSYGLNCKDLATVYALESSLALQPGGFGTGIEWMKQFNQSVSANFRFATVTEKSPYLKTSQSSYLKHYQDGSQVPSNRTTENRPRNWGSFKTSHDLRACSRTPISYPPPRTYQASYASQKRPSWYHDGPGNGNQTPASSSSFESRGRGWAQRAHHPKPDLNDDLASYTSFPSGSPYQQQNTQIYNNAGCGSKTNLTADIMSQLQGKDAATLANMIQQLVPYYPDLQNIDIHAFAQTLSEMN